MPWVFAVLVVIPLTANCDRPGRVKSTVPPALRPMLPRLSKSPLVPAVVTTIAEAPG